MSKYVEVEDCHGCPERYHDIIGYHECDRCGKVVEDRKFKEIPNVFKIPYWCPLPDLPTRDDFPREVD